MMQIIGHKMSFDTWKALETLYASTNHERIMQLQLKLHYAQKGSKKMADYLLRIKRTVDSLHAINELIQEKYHIMYILSGLGIDYFPLLCLSLLDHNKFD